MNQAESPGWSHFAALSAYWFAQSYKWFILLLAILPEQVKQFAPESKNTSWGVVMMAGAVWAMIALPCLVIGATALVIEADF